MTAVKDTVRTVYAVSQIQFDEPRRNGIRLGRSTKADNAKEVTSLSMTESIGRMIAPSTQIACSSSRDERGCSSIEAPIRFKWHMGLDEEGTEASENFEQPGGLRLGKVQTLRDLARLYPSNNSTRREKSHPAATRSMSIQGRNGDHNPPF